MINMSVHVTPPVTSPVKVIHDYARKNKLSVEYILEGESGPAHKKIFTMKLRLGEKEYIGVDRSIKAAQRAAAQAAVVEQQSRLSFDNHDDKSTQKQTQQPPTVLLNTWAAKNHIPTKYVLQHQIPTVSEITVHSYPRQLFHYRLFITDDFLFDGFGTSHSQARAHCASEALHFIQMNPKYIESRFPTDVTQTVEKSPITIMYENARKLGLPVTVECEGSTNVTYRIGEQYTATGTGINKQEAKHQAAENMLENLPKIDETNITRKVQKRNNQHKKFIEQKASASYSPSDDINPITRLYQIAQARNVTIKFEELDQSPNNKNFRFRVQYDEGLTSEGCGQSKQAAKRSAAENLLFKINPECFGSFSSPTTVSLSAVPSKSLLKRETQSGKTPEKKHVHFREDENKNGENKPTGCIRISIREQLIKACNKLNIQAQYQDESLNDSPHEYQSILSLATGDRLLAKFRGQGSSIENAQENVSNAAWKNLRQLFNGTIPTPKSNDKTSYQRIKPEISPSNE